MTRSKKEEPMSQQEEPVVDPEFVGDNPDVIVPIVEPTEEPPRQGFIRMHHPDTEGYADVTRQAFDEVWKEKGWTEIPPTGPQE